MAGDSGDLLYWVNFFISTLSPTGPQLDFHHPLPSTPPQDGFKPNITESAAGLYVCLLHSPRENEKWLGELPGGLGIGGFQLMQTRTELRSELGHEGRPWRQACKIHVPPIRPLRMFEIFHLFCEISTYTPMHCAWSICVSLHSWQFKLAERIFIWYFCVLL